MYCIGGEEEVTSETPMAYILQRRDDSVIFPISKLTATSPPLRPRIMHVLRVRVVGLPVLCCGLNPETPPVLRMNETCLGKG
jgi:hypothetical protein